MRGRRETERESFVEVWLTAFSAVFALERVWMDHKAAQNALNRMFFMWAHIGTVECWFSISDTCIRLHGKPTWLFFQSSIQGFPGGLFLFKNKCALNKDTLVTYIGNVNQNILKEPWDFYSQAVKTLQCHIFFMCVRSYLFIYSYPTRVNSSCQDDAAIQLFYTLLKCTWRHTHPHTHTHAHAHFPLLPHFSFNLRHVLFYSTLHLHPL